MLRITDITTQLVQLPLGEPIRTSIHEIDSVGAVLLSIHTNEGLVGESYAFTINAVRLKAFNEMILGFSHQLVGKEPFYVEAIWQSIWQEINPTGHKGLTISALSTLDTACWDIIGKSTNRPLHQLFGACRDSVNTYASGGLWLSSSIDQLQTQAEDYIKQGFQSMKIRLGSFEGDRYLMAKDIQRVKAVREVVGDKVDLMVDLNQALTPKLAIQLGRKLELYNLLWMEEPVAAYDLKGHAQVTNALDIQIASGETEYSRFGMQAMIDNKSCDILMPDLQRAGGLSEMRKIGALASANNMLFSTHIFTEHSLSIAGSCHNCMSVEHVPWFEKLFNEQMEIEQGKLKIPNRPGTGFTFNQNNIAQYKL